MRSIRKINRHAEKMLLDFCNLDRILKIDGEKALTYASNAFIINFSRAEKMAAEKGKSSTRCQRTNSRSL